MTEVRRDGNQQAGDAAAVIRALAQNLSPLKGQDAALRYAIEQGWLDADGAPTAAGRQVAEAMQQQSGTRTVFRNF